ncbi:MAG: Na/Pi cotransporter family protein [Erysipelotrichaceae bacterium]|nr:Na/Pi cotransporter family protein [Erysipelotrichaceae bacterium]
MTFKDILSVLTGLAIFLYGMEVMGNGFKHMAGGKLQDVLEKLTKKPVIAMLAGMLVTALVQSSGATTSMLVSFVNAGIMKVSQTVYVILGSNIGTTITGHLMAMDVGLVAPFLAFIGVCLIMFIKNDRLNAIGEIMMGLGFVFIGMESMSGGLKSLGDSPFFLNVLSNMQNPIFGILVGFALTTLVQSSSASLGIIQSLAKSNLVGIKDVMFFNLGQNIGSCTTAMLASLSFNRDAKRVSIINFTFNIINAVLFTILYSFLPFDRWYQMIAPGSVVKQIAMMHTFTNVVTSLVCFPFARALAKIAYLIIPDQGSEKKLQPEITQPTNIENNSVFNIYGINIEISNMFDIVETNIQRSLIALLEHYSVLDEVNKNENTVNVIHKGISRNLMLLMASNINMQESRQAASLFSINVDLERMSDHAVNLAEAGNDLVNSDQSFSTGTYDDLKQLAETVIHSLEALNMIIAEGDTSHMELIQKNEELIDQMCYENRNIEIQRIKDDKTDTESGIIYSEILIDIERIGDHILNVAESICENYQVQNS